MKALCNLGKKYDVELPICEAVYSVLYEGENLKEAFEKLFQRKLTNEFE